MKLSRILAPCVLAVSLVAPLTPASAAPAEVLLYKPGQGTVTLLNVGDKVDKLPGAPRSFRAFARAEMRATWQGYLGGKPACKGVPHITVSGLRTDGYAFGNVSERPRPGCQSGGGYVALWAVRQGEWKQVIGTQDVVDCARLEQLGVPSAIGVDQCYDGHDVVAYVHD